MKKVYEKPLISFENFALSTNIAGDCNVKTETPSYGQCAYVVSAGTQSWNIFLSTMTGICTTTEDFDGVADDAYNKICYNTPFGESLFNS